MVSAKYLIMGAGYRVYLPLDGWRNLGPLNIQGNVSSNNVHCHNDIPDYCLRMLIYNRYISHFV